VPLLARFFWAAVFVAVGTKRTSNDVRYSVAIARKDRHQGLSNRSKMTHAIIGRRHSMKGNLWNVPHVVSRSQLERFDDGAPQ